MLNLLIIGDSIAKGYGSTDATGGYGALLGQKLDAQVTNLGVIGLDSAGLLDRLQTEKFQTAIADADVICISIGSNDLLKPFLNAFADAVKASGEEKELFGEIQKKLEESSKNNPALAADMLSTAMKTLTNNSKLQKSCERFPEHFQKIISEIKSQNPDVLLYVNNIYNPYYGVAYEFNGISIFNVQQLCEGYIQKINTAFDSQSPDYTLMDMYSVFRQPGYTHVSPGSLFDLSSINFDPHPNDAGYQMMADYIYARMDSTVPEAVSFEAVMEEDALQGFTVEFSEPVRLIAKKKLILQDDTKEDSFSYTIKETSYVERNEEQKAVLQLSVDEFEPDSENVHKELQSGAEYKLEAEEGAIKDRGNNHLKNASIGSVKMPQNTETVILTGSNDVKNVKFNALRVWMIAAALGALMMVAFLIIRKHRKHRKKSRK